MKLTEETLTQVITNPLLDKAVEYDGGELTVRAALILSLVSQRLSVPDSLASYDLAVKIKEQSGATLETAEADLLSATVAKNPAGLPVHAIAQLWRAVQELAK